MIGSKPPGFTMHDYLQRLSRIIILYIYFKLSLKYFDLNIPGLFKSVKQSETCTFNIAKQSNQFQKLSLETTSLYHKCDKGEECMFVNPYW